MGRLRQVDELALLRLRRCAAEQNRGFPRITAQAYFLVRTITAEMSEISTAPSKNSAAVSCER